MRALILSGAGRYADPWHPFAATSALLARVLAIAGFDAEVDDDVDGGLTRLAGIDLLVVNAADPWASYGDAPRTPPAPPSSVAGLAAALDRGIGVLAVHRALASLRDHPEWAPAIGAMWVPEGSWHPPIGATRVRGLTFPDGSPVDGFDVFDERYLRLQLVGRSHVVAEHEGPDGMPEPTAWVRTHGSSRIAVDALGHDERSYESTGHRALIARLALWAVGREATGVRRSSAV